MPYVTNGNIYAPVMMLAEKAADLILGNTPLPPSTVEFYRHDPTPKVAAAAAAAAICGFSASRARLDAMTDELRSGPTDRPDPPTPAGCLRRSRPSWPSSRRRSRCSSRSSRSGCWRRGSARRSRRTPPRSVSSSPDSPSALTSADARPTPSGLAGSWRPVLLVSAALVALVAPAIDVAAEVLKPPSGPVGATILAVAGLLLPSIVLAAATSAGCPRQHDLDGRSGSVVGRISAIATVGALLGTFLTGFVLLAVAPVRRHPPGRGGRPRADRRRALHLVSGRSGGGVIAVLGLAAIRHGDRANGHADLRPGVRLLLHPDRSTRDASRRSAT